MTVLTPEEQRPEQGQLFGRRQMNYLSRGRRTVNFTDEHSPLVAMPPRGIAYAVVCENHVIDPLGVGTDDHSGGSFMFPCGGCGFAWARGQECAMSNDVYAGDQSLNAGGAQENRLAWTEITLTADADPDILLRVAATLNTLNEAPHSFHMTRQERDEVRITVTLLKCSERRSEMLRRKLETLTSVRTVVPVSSDGPSSA